MFTNGKEEKIFNAWLEYKNFEIYFEPDTDFTIHQKQGWFLNGEEYSDISHNTYSTLEQAIEIIEYIVKLTNIGVCKYESHI